MSSPLTGHQAFALGALRAGVSLITTCPDTAPQTLEYADLLAKQNNLSEFVIQRFDKAEEAVSTAANSAVNGARTLSIVRATDLLTTLNLLLGLPSLRQGGFLILVIESSEPSSSQAQFDIRLLAEFAQIPLFDPATPEEAVAMINVAFQLSEDFMMPVVINPTAHVCNAITLDNFTSDYLRQFKSENVPIDSIDLAEHHWLLPHERSARFARLAKYSSSSLFNHIEQTGLSPAPAHLGIVADGSSWATLSDALTQIGYVGSLKLFKIGMPVAFPEQLAHDFIRELDQVLVIEGQSPLIRRHLLELSGRYQLKTKLFGHLDDTISYTDAASASIIAQYIRDFISV